MKKSGLRVLISIFLLSFYAANGFSQPCAGTPAASNSLSSAASVCDGEIFSLTLDNVYVETGYTYQWQSSPDGISYSDIGGATNDNYNASQSAATYYQCIITCTNSTLSTTSTAVLVNMNAFTSCYCPVSFPTDVEPITLVNFAGINNATSEIINGSPAQEDYTAMIGAANQGYTYPITLKGNTNGNFTDYFSVFIDFNQNGSYLDAGEAFDIGTITNSTGIDVAQLTGNITIPIAALTGTTGMRVIKRNVSFAGSCNASGSGQAEDYLITISACIPPVSITLAADDPDGIICPGTNVTFTANAGYAYYDFQVNASSVQTGTSDNYSSAALNNGDNVTVIAGYDATCATTSNTINITYHSVPSGSIAVTNITCNGDNDGALDLTVSGGTSPFTFIWSNTATTEDISALAPGGYTVTITDANLCSSTANETVNEPALLTTNLVTANITCFGLADGAIDQTISGGTGGYTIDWDNDGTGDFDDTEDLLSLIAGTYNVVVMDANSCTANNSAAITEPAQLTVSVLATDLLCNGDGNGAIDATITGGTLPYVIDWDNDGTGDNDDPEDLTGLSGGNFNIVVIDANNCTASSGISVIEPPALITSISPSDVLCNGGNTGSIDLTVTGGTGLLTFDWDSDGTGDNDDPEDLNFLVTGTYNVIVTDANNCVATDGVTINEPTNISTSVTQTDVTCFGANNGTVDLTVAGGVGPYTFDWDIDGSGDYDDAEDQVGLAPGSYFIQLMDANGCGDAGSITITEPALLVVTLSATDISCNGNSDGTIDAAVNGGTTAYIFDWDNDGTGDNDDTEDLSSLGAGIYAIIVIDANGCTASANATITEPAVLSSSLTSVNILCNSDSTGSIDLTASGGITPYIFDWDNDGMGDNDDTEDLTNMPAGTYNVIITDTNGCVTNNSVSLTEPIAISYGTTQTDVTCFGDGDGAIDLTVSGGVSPYTFDWDNDGTGDFDDAEDLDSLSGGTYHVTVIDTNGCVINDSVVIAEAGLLDLSVVENNITCNGLTDGAIDMTISGGNIPFMIDWDNDGIGDFDDTEDLAGLSAGNYFVAVVDVNGCNDTITATIIEPAILTFLLTATDVTCAGLDNGTIDVTVTGGTLPYLIDWDMDGTGDFDDSLDQASLPGGAYTVSITDTNNCITFDSTVTIIGPAAIGLSSTTTDAICSNVGNGVVDLTIVGGTGAYSILWSNSATTEDLNNVAAGTYSVVVLDVNGCSATLSDTVGYTYLSPTVTLTLSPDTICNTDTAYVLTGGMPAGGNYNGTGVSGNMLNPGTAGAGFFVIIYTYTDTTGCFNTAVDQIQIDDCLGIGEIEAENAFLMYPNPTTGMFTIETEITNGNLTVMNGIGQTIYSGSFNSNRILIDLTANERGVYFVVIDSEGGTFVQKLIKE